jgi:hypothetical protein
MCEKKEEKLRYDLSLIARSLSTLKVPLKSLKFLDKRFSQHPVLAINARFANIGPPSKGVWKKDVINYLLNRVQGKVFEAKVIGYNQGKVSLEIYDRTTAVPEKNLGVGSPPGTLININQRLVMDGHGTMYDESKDADFEPFETWQTSLLSMDPDAGVHDAANSAVSYSDLNDLTNGTDAEEMNADSFMTKRKKSVIDRLNQKNCLSQIFSPSDHATKGDTVPLEETVVTVKYKIGVFELDDEPKEEVFFLNYLLYVLFTGFRK